VAEAQNPSVVEAEEAKPPDKLAIRPASDAPALVSAEIEDEFDRAYERALQSGETLPFGRFSRHDDHGWRFRDVRQTDPCTLKQVFRRKTYDPNKGVVIEDIYKADLDPSFKWRAALPEAPRAITTIFYYYIDGDVQDLQLAIKTHREKTLKVPNLPGPEEIQRHNLTHTPFASWCEHCIAGRSRGALHKRVAEVADQLFEFDYTFYSENGYAVLKEHQERAQCVLTGVHRGSGMCVSTVCLKKAAWPYAVTLVGNFVLMIGCTTPVLRGDAEPSLMFLLNAVATWLRQKGVTARVPEAAPVTSHQSIGAAEKHHDILAGYIRTMASMIKAKTGLQVEPRMRLFVWMVRHASTLVNIAHLRKNGQTSHYMLRGFEASYKLAQFAEIVMFKIQVEHTLRSKALPRWGKGVYAGVREKDGASIILTPHGVETSRSISRLPEEYQWNAPALTQAAGLPWHKTEGAISEKDVLASKPMIAPAPNIPEAIEAAAVEKGEADERMRDRTAMTVQPAPATPAALTPAPSTPLPKPASGASASASASASGPQQQPGLKRPANWPAQSASAFPNATAVQDDTRLADLGKRSLEPPAKKAGPSSDNTSETTKKVRFSESISALWAEAMDFHEHEVEVPDDEDLVGEISEYFTPESDDKERLKLRLEEIEKLEGFGSFVAIDASAVPAGAKIYRHKWVDTEPKSRLTCADLKRFSRDLPVEAHVPTPSNYSNNIFDFYACLHNLNVISMDAVSAYLHAKESKDDCFMYPPVEWEEHNNIKSGSKIWKLEQSLYGRRTAGCQFRDFFEALATACPELQLVRGHHEPCGYFSREHNLLILHHVDDIRMCGPHHSMTMVIQHMSQYLLLKISPPIGEDMSYDYLHRRRIRIKDGWIKVPSHKVLERVLKHLDLFGKSLNVPVTPSVKREHLDGDEDELDDVTQYRAAVGGLMYFSTDVEVVAYAAKECARGMSKPTVGNMKAVTRLARWLSDKLDWGVELKVTGEANAKGKYKLTVQCDSDCAGDEKGRSTSGYRILCAGYLLGHASVTQPGLPALSSGEAETRTTSRAACDAIYVQSVLQEWGIETEVELESDASVACLSAQKLSGGRMRHVRACESFIRSLVKRRLVKVKKIPTKDNTSDLLTKHVKTEVLNYLLPNTGYRKLLEDELAKPSAEMTRINDIKVLKDAAWLVEAHEKRMTEKARAVAIAQSTQDEQTDAEVSTGGA